VFDGEKVWFLMFIVEFEGWLFSSELCGCDKEVTYDCGEGNVYSTGIESEFGNSNGGKRGLGVGFFGYKSAISILSITHLLGFGRVC
jgi:hypothetical protein